MTETTPAAAASLAPDPLFDAAAGLINRAVYSDEAVYRHERRSIFGRAWLFLGHESQLAQDGDFITGYLGDQPVLCWRGPGTELRVFLNDCPRGMQAVTTADDGNAEVLNCPCHHWPFSRDGWLDGRPAPVMVEVPHVASYKGLVFASLDPQAPSLAGYLADIDWYLDLLLDAGGGKECSGGVVKSLIQANWKLPMQSFAGDLPSPDSIAGDVIDAFQVSAGFGCLQAGWEAVEGETDGSSPGGEAAQRLRPWAGAVFPNLGLSWQTGSLHVFHPRGPRRVEMWSYSLFGPQEDEAIRRKRRQSISLEYGPASVRHLNRTTAWEQITALSSGTIARREPLALQPPAARYHEELPGRLADLQSDLNLGAFYRQWQLMLQEQDWSILLQRVSSAS